ncbi:MAG TPA: histidine kinase [Actinomycetota bacterium]|jgi:signal transduction histidine kinase|nr:histidine kinase [Actinomycetota bacterium]
MRRQPMIEQPLRRLARRWWARRAVVVDLGLAVLLFGPTADQGTGLELGFLGTTTRVLPSPARTLLAAALALLVLVRRRSPYPLLALAAAAWIVMNAPLGLLIGVYTLSAAPHRPRRDAALVGLLALVVLADLAIDPAVSASTASAVTVTVLVIVLPALLGMWIGARRALVANLREKAARLEREQHLEADQARAQERARIAREMHDVVAHRVSLMILHAGALEVSLADADAAEQAGLIRQSGRQALEELRHILGVLRERDSDAPLDPQPTLADLDQIVQQSRDARMPVSLQVEGQRRTLPPTVERTAYRLVQEALTNAHKHAAGAATQIRLSYQAERLEVTVRNARPASAPDPGLALGTNGHGLLGLRERVTLLGGSFHAGPRLDGGFEVRASIPTRVPA